MIKNRLKRILKRRHLTIKDLIIRAKRKGLKLSASNVYKFTGNQTHTYRINLMDDICKVLHINVNQLIYSVADDNTPFHIKRKQVNYPKAKLLINRNNQKRKLKPITRHICSYKFILQADKNKSTSFIMMTLKNCIVIGISPKNKLSMYLLNPFILKEIAIKAIHQELGSISEFSNKFKDINFDIFKNDQDIRELWDIYTFHPNSITDHNMNKYMDKLNKESNKLNTKRCRIIKEQKPNHEFKECMVPHINKCTSILVKPLIDIGYSDPNKVIAKAKTNRFNNIYPYNKYNAISGSFSAETLNNTQVSKPSRFVTDSITDLIYKTKQGQDIILILDVR